VGTRGTSARVGSACRGARVRQERTVHFHPPPVKRFVTTR
jgi:hypothetical protein